MRVSYRRGTGAIPLHDGQDRARCAVRASDRVIPAEAVEAAVDAMSGVDVYDLRALATDILEAAAPYMLAKEGEQ